MKPYSSLIPGIRGRVAGVQSMATGAHAFPDFVGLFLGELRPPPDKKTGILPAHQQDCFVQRSKRWNLEGLPLYDYRGLDPRVDPRRRTWSRRHSERRGRGFGPEPSPDRRDGGHLQEEFALNRRCRWVQRRRAERRKETPHVENLCRFLGERSVNDEAALKVAQVFVKVLGHALDERTFSEWPDSVIIRERAWSDDDNFLKYKIHVMLAFVNWVRGRGELDHDSLYDQGVCTYLLMEFKRADTQFVLRLIAEDSLQAFLPTKNDDKGKGNRKGKSGPGLATEDDANWIRMGMEDEELGGRPLVEFLIRSGKCRSLRLQERVKNWKQKRAAVMVDIRRVLEKFPRPN